MILFRKSADLVSALRTLRGKGIRTGFVPTMGALHEGHLSLIRLSVSGNDRTISSIFINPAQFNDPKDFEKYPVTIEEDLRLLEQNGCDIVFLPGVDEVYPPGFDHKRVYDLGYLEAILEGKFRPGHFQGVCRVIHRFMDLVEPDRFYLGQKDYQQCLVVDRLLQLIGREGRPELIIAPTTREADGLAMSSRNIRLSPELRGLAPLIHRELIRLQAGFEPAAIAQLTARVRKNLAAAGFRVDYAEVADAANLLPPSADTREFVVLVAAFLGDVRLIDNQVIRPGEHHI